MAIEARQMTVTPKRLADYQGSVDPEILEEIERLSKQLKGLKVVHVNSTKLGGGVAEILRSLVPLMNGLGLETDWQVMEGDQEFFRVTKSFHNALQGAPVVVTLEMFERYLRINDENAKRLDLNADAVIIHDQQPAALVAHRPKDAVWIWRCHIDLAREAPPARLARPQQGVWDFLRPYVEQYDGAIFTMPEFAQDLNIPQHIVPPSIDPLSEKNLDLSDEEIARTCENLGIPRDKRILLQVSRFDRFKDPVGVVQAYRLFQQLYPEFAGRTCLVLAGGGATDDPEGAEVLAEVEARAGDASDILILERPPTSHREINALQRGADVIIQKSTREGFGLVVTEALWKRKPVVASPVGGINLQILDGLTGYLTRTPEELADRLAYLLQHPQVATRLGEAGHKHVRQHFLTPRELRDYLRVIADHVD
jgi:trehalose synthase